MERLKESKAGVVAFCRTGRPRFGEWDDAVIIARHGRTPGELDEIDEIEIAPEDGFNAA